MARIVDDRNGNGLIRRLHGLLDHGGHRSLRLRKANDGFGRHRIFLPIREPKEGPTDVALFIGGIPCHPSYDHSALIAIPDLPEGL
jgi:hypothetical protein